MDIQTNTATWLSSRLSLEATSSSIPLSDATIEPQSSTPSDSSYQSVSPVIAIADKISDTTSAMSVVILRQGSLGQLGDYLASIQAKVLELGSADSVAEQSDLSEQIDSLEKEMSVFIAENMISDVSGSIQQRNVPDTGFERFIQILDSQTEDGSEGFLATIEVDMATVLSHAHSPLNCPICEAQAGVNTGTPISEDAATTTTTNVTGAVATSVSSDGYVEALTHSMQWDLSDGEKLSYSFYTGSVSYGGYGSIVYPNHAAPLNATQQEQMREVYDLWDAASNIEFEEITETDANNVGELRVAYMTDPSKRTGAAAFAYIPNNGTTGGDAWYIVDGVQDANDNFAYNLDFSQGYGRLVALHEIGHSIGLSHPHDESSATGATFADYGIQDDTNTTVMSYTQAPSLTFYDNGGSLGFKSIYASTPMVYDIAAVEYLYGDITDTNSGDTTYAITDHQYIQTLVDTGGVDTIDVSSVAHRSIIDLTPGSFNDVGYATAAEQDSYWSAQGIGGYSISAQSSVFTGTDNLGIALSATIENIIGSAGNDEFTGNSVNNVIKGNAGDDQINGGGGNANYAVFNGSYSGYAVSEVSLGSGIYTVEDIDLSDGDDGTDTIRNVQYFEFADITYNPRSATSETTGQGALTGNASTPSGATGAVATAISIAAKPASQSDGGFTPFAAAHSISGINLLTDEGREEALILLEIGLSHIRSQSSRLAGLETELESGLNVMVGAQSSNSSRNATEIEVVASLVSRDVQGLIAASLPQSTPDIESLRSLVASI